MSGTGVNRLTTTIVKYRQFPVTGSVLIRCGSCGFHSSSSNYKDPKTAFHVAREARFLKKLMTGISAPTYKFYNKEQPVSKIFTELGSTVRGPSGKPIKSRKGARRVEVLNTVFMEQITSLLSTGEMSTEVLGLGITVSRVKVSSDLSRVNVYWIASGSEKDEEIDKILRKAAGKLRHELTQLRVVGVIPPIEFVRDRTFSKSAEVEHLLAKCDFGNEFVPTSFSALFSQIDDLKKKFRDANENEPYAMLDKEQEANAVGQAKELTETDLYESLPMRQDVLGVKYDKIIGGIKEISTRVKNKKAGSSSGVDISFGAEGDVSSQAQDPELADYSASQMTSIQATREEVALAKKRQHDFFKYLKKQKVTRDIVAKQLTAEAKDKDFNDEEAFERWQNEVFRNIDDEDYDDEDNYVEHDQKFYSSPNDQR